MAKYDGMLVIGTRLDTSDLEKQLRDEEKELEKLQNQEVKLKKKKEEVPLSTKKAQEEIRILDKKIAMLNKQKIDIETNRPSKMNGLAYKLLNEDIAKQEGIKQEYLDEINKKYEVIDESIAKNVAKQKALNKAIDETNKKLTKSKILDNISNVGKNIKSKVGNATEKVSNKMAGVTKNVAKWALALFAIRSAYSAIRSAMNMITSQNEELQQKINDIKYSLAYTIEPLITWFVNTIYQLLGYVRLLIKQLTNKDIFASAVKNTNKMKKNVQDTGKQLAGFDEMNVLNDTSSKNTENVMNAVEFTDPKDMETTFKDVFDKIKDWWRNLVDFLKETDWYQLGQDLWDGIKEWFTNIDWEGIYTSWSYGLGALIGSVVSFIGGLAEGIWEDVKSYFQGYIDDAGGNVIEGILNGIINAIKNIGQWIYDNIFVPFIDGFKDAFDINSPSKVMEEQGQYIIDGLVEGIKGIWDKVKGFIIGLVDGIKEILGTCWDWIKNTIGDLWNNAKSILSGIAYWVYNTIIRPIVNYFSGLINTIKSGFNIVKSTLSSVMNTIWGIVKTPINWIIDAINTLIRGINKIRFDVPDWVPSIGGQKFGFNVPTLPRLAKGGIINNPGKGVPVAIGGEVSKEAVLPLTDSQQMQLLGEAIGKYITINANIVNTMNGRIISRELQTIQNEQDFAYNR